MPTYPEPTIVINCFLPQLIVPPRYSFHTVRHHAYEIINVDANEKDLQNKNIVIENLNKEIILLKKELEKIQSSNISHIQDNTSVLDKIKELGKKTKLIQDRIKESVK